MAQAGLHAYIAILAKNKLPMKKWFLVSFILGSIIPDIDAFFVLIGSFFIPLANSIEIFYRSVTHNVFIIIFLYLLFLIIYEFSKNKKYLIIGSGLFLGISLHLIIDIFFWFDSIHIFWPLPTERLDLWKFFSVSTWLSNLFMLFEFVFFRLLAWELIKMLINSEGSKGKYLKLLSYFMKLQLIQILTFSIFLYFLNSSSIYYIFATYYTFSLLLILYIIFKIRDSINKHIFIKKDEKDQLDFDNKKSAIKNIE